MNDTHATLGALLAAALLATAPAVAQDNLVELPLRVLSVDANRQITVDRGSRDGLRRGDVFELRPATGGTFRARVLQVEERTALAEPADRTFVPPPGTRGSIRVPRDRIRTPARPGPPPPDPARVAEHPPWQNRDERWQDGMPLLAGIGPVRPEERPPALTGRVFAFGGLGSVSGNDDHNTVFRLGADLDARNLLHQGGDFHVDAELDYRYEEYDTQGIDLLVRRFSYAIGGHRFAANRYEIGRFLHRGMPEFGIVDGIEWNHRLAGGSRFGASVGFLPEIDEDFDSLEDLQVSAFYEWVADADETTRLAIGFQKTWHNGESDRDLLVTTFHRTPLDGWHVHGDAWIDFYDSDDAFKGSGAELTAGSLYFSRRFETGTGLEVGWRRLRFPELLRTELLPPLLPAELADDRYDRLSFKTWAESDGGDRLQVLVTGFDDEHRTGGAGEISWTDYGALLDGGRLELAALGGRGRFERYFGGRLSYGSFGSSGSWQALYEVLWHRLDDRPPDGDDLVQHRVALTLDHRTASGWVLGLSGSGVFFDDDIGWSAQFTMQRSF